jgi:hypothetical protein
MNFVERKVRYFEAKGQDNTVTVLSVVDDYMRATGVKDVVVASTSGETGVLASKAVKDANLVVVSHHTGFREPGLQELTPENRQRILASGAKILTATHALSGPERAIRRDFNTIEPVEIIANTLRLLGEGTKVCVEIVLMAADAGLIPIDREVVAVGGSGRGADTALLIKPANASRLFDLEIREVIAKPRCLE